MTKIVWLSDLHFSAEGPVFGIDTTQRVAEAIHYINSRYAEAEACVISGDLVNRGTEADYLELAKLFATLKPPVFPMVGNHDDRDLLKKHLSVPATTMDRFVQYAVSVSDCTILCLDTLDPGADHGAFCPERSDWLTTRLQEAGAGSVIVFAHHPPIALGLPMQDQDCLKDDGRLLAALTDHAHTPYLCCGHVHRPVTGVVQGIPFSTLRSALFQAPPPVPDWTWAGFSPANEAPQLAILDVSDTGVTIQFHDFCISASEIA